MPSLCEPRHPNNPAYITQLATRLNKASRFLTQQKKKTSSDEEAQSVILTINLVDQKFQMPLNQYHQI